MLLALTDIETFIPHRGSMRLIHRLLAVDDETVRVEAEVPEDGPFLSSPSSAPAYLLIEMMAQTISAWDGWHRLAKGETPRVGYLLGTRKFHCDTPQLHPGEILEIHAREILSDGEMGSFACQALRRPPSNAEPGQLEPFANATLSVYRPEKSLLEPSAEGDP